MQSKVIRMVCVSTTIIFLVIMLILPMIIIFIEAFAKGVMFFTETLFSEYVLSAALLSMGVTLTSVLFATVFGIAAAWCMAHFRFPGRALLSGIIDLPISISPIIVGLMFVLLYGKYGYVGNFLEAGGFVVIFSWPGLVLTNMCITTPYVLRSILPSMQALASHQEEAARMLGASGWHILLRVTLPRIQWALLYGIILALARSVGEFGAASVVSGFIRKKTVTLPLLVEIYYSEYLSTAAFSTALLFVLISVLTLSAKYITKKNSVEYRAAIAQGKL